MGVPNTAATFWPRLAPPDDRGCREWTGETDKRGYGRLRWQQRRPQAHRVAWLLTHGDPGEAQVLHECDNPPCCEPSHLFLGDNATNRADSVQKGRQARGSGHGIAVLDEDAVRAVRRELTAGTPYRQIATRFGVSKNTVWRISTGACWGWLDA